MAPQLVVEFWDRVERLLIDRFDLREADAHLWTLAYREQMDRREIGETVYNRGIEASAAAIAAAQREGEFPQPQNR